MGRYGSQLNANLSVIFTDGFESGINWTEGANGSGAVYAVTTDPTEVHSGLQAAKLTAGPEKWHYTGMTASTITYQADGTYTMTIWFLLKQNVNIGVECCFFFYDGTNRWQPLIHWINEYGVNKLGYLNSTNTWVDIATGINVSINTYHKLELVANFATKTITEIHFDGAVYPVNALMPNTASTASPKITPDLAVWTEGASLVTACIDDVSVQLGTASPPTSHTITLTSNPLGVQFTSPVGVTPFTVSVNDGANITVQTPPTEVK